MDFPALMPKQLDYCLSIPDETSLFNLLIKRSNDLTLFFEAASDDETWSEAHEEFLKMLLDWFTTQTYQDRLIKNNYLKVALAIHKHYPILKHLLTENVVIKLKDGEISMNGLLLAAASDFFRDLILTESSKESSTLSFPQLTKAEFASIEEYIRTGQVLDLKTQGLNDIIELIKRAKGWELNTLSCLAEYTLKKYLNTENVFSMLFQAKKEQWIHFAEYCVTFINEQSWGFKLSIPFPERLAFQFLNFQEPTIDFFEELRPLVTDIICSGNLIDQPQFGLILKECPDLYLLDISRTSFFSDQIQEAPRGLRALNLSECPWINKDYLKNIFSVTKQIKHLFLCNNVHLNFLFWGELAKIKTLSKLDLSNCTQLQDSDLSVLIKGLKGLTELSVGNCKKIDEAGFLELAKGLPKLIRLDLSRTNVSDTALIEIISNCRYLTTLDVSSCGRLTEKGIFGIVKTGLSLQSLNVSHTNISDSNLEGIKKNYPQLLTYLQTK